MIEGLARTYEAVPLLEAPAIGTLVEGMQLAFSGVLAAALQVCAPGRCSRSCSPTPRSASSRASCRSSTSSPSASRPRSTVGLVLIGASLPFVAGWLDDELERSVGSALHALKVSG